MEIHKVFNTATIAKALGINYFRLNRVMKGTSKNGFRNSERKSIKEYIDIQAANCKMQIDEL